MLHLFLSSDVSRLNPCHVSQYLSIFVSSLMKPFMNLFKKKRLFTWSTLYFTNTRMNVCTCYRFPVLALAIAVVLLCFYLRFKRKRLTYGVATPTAQDGDTSLVLRTIAYPEVQAEEDRYGEVFPPQYSDVDHPPPYSLVSESASYYGRIFYQSQMVFWLSHKIS